MKVLVRLARAEYRALTALAYGVTANDRFAGLRHSSRVEAKWLLIALSPALPLMIWDQIGLERNLIWYALASLAGLFYTFLVGTLMFVMCKVFMKSLDRKRG